MTIREKAVMVIDIANGAGKWGAACDVAEAYLAAERKMAAMEEALKLVRDYWTFDNHQHHTHTWHDREECMAKIAKALSSTPKEAEG